MFGVCLEWEFTAPIVFLFNGREELDRHIEREGWKSAQFCTRVTMFRIEDNISRDETVIWERGK